MTGDQEFTISGFVVRRGVLEKGRLLRYRRQILAEDLAPGDVLSSEGVGAWLPFEPLH